MGKPRGAYWGEGCAEIAASFRRPRTRKEHELIALAEKNRRREQAEQGRSSFLLSGYPNKKRKTKRPQVSPADYWRNRAHAAEARLKRQSAAEDFYSSERWRTLRYKALKASNGKCHLCQATGQLHVDHIKPRSRYPELALVLSNLQVLCKDCNLGKGAWDATDWRRGNLRLVPDNG